MPEPSDPVEVVLDDPRALRAIAHPARHRVMTELYTGRTLTATQAAEMCAETPSAMSYHLRQLEKWGIVVRDEAGSDARERPWRAAGSRLRLAPAAAGDPAAVAAVVDTFFADLQRSFAAHLAAPKQLRRPGAMQRTIARLTPDEGEALVAELGALHERLDELDRGNPPDTQQWEVFVAVLPRVPG